MKQFVSVILGNFDQVIERYKKESFDIGQYNRYRSINDYLERYEAVSHLYDFNHNNESALAYYLVLYYEIDEHEMFRHMVGDRVYLTPTAKKIFTVEDSSLKEFHLTSFI